MIARQSVTHCSLGNVQLGVWIGAAGSHKRDREVVSAEHTVEHTVPPVATIISSLIHDIPVVALAKVVSHDVGDVCLNDFSERCAGPRAAAHPVGKLRVPSRCQLMC